MEASDGVLVVVREGILVVGSEGPLAAASEGPLAAASDGVLAVASDGLLAAAASEVSWTAGYLHYVVVGRLQAWGSGSVSGGFPAVTG